MNKKFLLILISIMVGVGTGLGTGLVDVLKPYSALIGAISALVIAIIGIIRQKTEE